MDIIIVVNILIPEELLPQGIKVIKLIFYGIKETYMVES